MFEGTHQISWCDLRFGDSDFAFLIGLRMSMRSIKRTEFYIIIFEWHRP